MFRSSQKKQNNYQKLLGTKQKIEKKSFSYICENCTHTVRDASQARKYTFPINSTKLDMRPDRPLVGPHTVAVCVIFEETALGFLRGIAIPCGWLVGGTEMLSAAMTLGFSVHISPTFQPRSVLKV